MVARKGYGRAADYWSLGCIRPPFESRKGSKELFRMVMNQRVEMPHGASAPACKVLKGLLSRDAHKAGLKQMDFFAGLDWIKLERKEIDPPERFDVEHDEDVTHFHFHEEHVESDMFKGFSFVHDDFALPERDGGGRAGVLEQCRFRCLLGVGTCEQCLW